MPYTDITVSYLGASCLVAFKYARVDTHGEWVRTTTLEKVPASKADDAQANEPRYINSLARHGTSRRFAFRACDQLHWITPTSRFRSTRTGMCHTAEGFTAKSPYLPRLRPVVANKPAPVDDICPTCRCCSCVVQDHDVSVCSDSGIVLNKNRTCGPRTEEVKTNGGRLILRTPGRR